MIAALVANGWLSPAVVLLVLLALVKPLGWYMARVYMGEPGSGPLGLGRVLGPLERLTYRVAGVDVHRGMTWRVYALVLLVIGVAGFVATYGLQLVQASLPLNPQGLADVEAGSAFNTAISFVTNTNWQGYAGESTMSSLTQMLGLTVQNFVSAAMGMAAMAALARGLSSRGRGEADRTLGNAWVDLVRGTYYILVPLSIVLALALVSQGVVQSFEPARSVELLRPLEGVATQTLPLGPVASQIAIKQLGTNGGGFFNVNSAHPFENPTAFSNLLEIIAILLIPAGLCFTFGEMVRDRRQGWAIAAAMATLLVAMLVPTLLVEQSGNPRLTELGVDAVVSMDAPGGNMEGKESRFGVAASGLWAVATTAASNGSVNSMHDSYMPLGGLALLWLMQIGEVAFGGVGSGLYGMILFVVLAVFVAGLMVGRTPEYLGKRIEPFEMKMASLGILIPCALTLVSTAIAVATPLGATTSNPGAHGFSQILYACSSASNNNGSAFAGLSANTTFYNTLLGACMHLSRFGTMIPVLALAGSMAAKAAAPTTQDRSIGVLSTHTPLFVTLLVATVVIVGALTFVPALALGPVAEALQMREGLRP